MISLKEKSIGKNKNGISEKEKLGRQFELWKLTLEVKVVVLKNFVPWCEFCSLNTLVLSEREKVKSQILFSIKQTFDLSSWRDEVSQNGQQWKEHFSVGGFASN